MAEQNPAGRRAEEQQQAANQETPEAAAQYREDQQRQAAEEPTITGATAPKHLGASRTGAGTGAQRDVAKAGATGHADQKLPERTPHGFYGGADGAQPFHADDLPSQEELDKAAAEHEQSMARTRGVTDEEQLRDYRDKVKWVVSNRLDDRTVLWEIDPIHPGGQAFIGGSTPDLVYPTPNVEIALQNGEAMEMPAPNRWLLDEDGDPVMDESTGQRIPNPRYPIQAQPDQGVAAADQPGRPTRLGRKLDPMLWHPDVHKEIRKRQAHMPSVRPVPPGGIVPPANTPV